jgi:hypothetical protein
MNFSPDAADGRTPGIALKLFVVFHVLAITVWALPDLPPEVAQGKEPARGTQNLLAWNERTLKPSPPVRVYLQTTGFWQYWDMFAPNPSQTDRFASAEIEFADGTRRPLPYPRLADYPVWARYSLERYRKFQDRFHLDENRYLWPFVARRVARNAFTDPKNPPKRVWLTRHWMIVQPPGRPQWNDYAKFTYFEYIVSPEDLEAN